MSKKQLFNRLDNFFSNLEEEVRPLPVEQQTQKSGWTWQCNAAGIYLTCSTEIESCLGIPAEEFIGKPLLSYHVDIEDTKVLQEVFQNSNFPAEVSVSFIDSRGSKLPVRVFIMGGSGVNGAERHLNGFCRVTNIKIPLQSLATSHSKEIQPLGLPSLIKRIPEDHPQAINSTNLPRPERLKAKKPASSIITIPFGFGNQEKGLVEIVDETNPGRTWTDDEKQLVQEVANQLGLALENAQLYTTVQQELSERIKAEQEILRRNQELATLNQIGQQLSAQTTIEDVYKVISENLGQLVDDRNFTMAIYHTEDKTFSFPIHKSNGENFQLPNRQADSELPEWVLKTRVPLLFNQDVEKQLKNAGINRAKPVPLSLLAIPLFIGERSVGAMLFENYEQEKAFQSIQVELLSTLASQVTTALENARMFQEIRTALGAIENRERYQANVARAVAILTESGTNALPEVLATLAKASQNSRLYFAQVKEDENGHYWSQTAEWVDKKYSRILTQYKLQHLSISSQPNLVNELRDKGWTITRDEGIYYSEKELNSGEKIGSSLKLAVPGKQNIPNFLAFDQVGASRKWLNEEISVLRVAADAISNTLIREDLLDRVQVSLDETGSLYNASHQLALANNMQEMVAAISNGVHSNDVHQAVLVLFNYDNTNKISGLSVAANWYSGHGTPPPPVGQEYPRSNYEKLFQGTGVTFIEDIMNWHLDAALQDLLAKQNIRSLAILPLWASKRQLGALLLISEERHHFNGREVRSYPPLVDQMAISIENLRLFQQSQESLAETEKLYKISAGIAQAAKAEDLLTLIAQEILPINAEQATLILIHQNLAGDLTELEIVGHYDRINHYQPAGTHLQSSVLPLISTFGMEATIIPNTQNSEIDSISKNTFLGLGMHSACIIPLRAEKRLVGLIIASSNLPTEFDPEDVKLLGVAGSGVAVALEKQRLLNEAQRRVLELQTAAEIARDTTSTLSLDTLLNRIIGLLVERFKFYHAGIYLIDELKAFAVIQEASGTAGREMKKQKYRIEVGSKSIIGTVTASGKPLIVDDVHQSPLYQVFPRLESTLSEMAIPLKLGKRIIGTLDIHSDRLNAFTQDDVTVLQILADQIAVAIDNARSYELAQKAVEEMKEVDRLKSQFLANMSHELRTPLNSIIGFSRVILKGIDGPVNEMQQQDLTAIYNSGQHLLVLINDILDLSKIEAGKMELAFSDINISDLINSVMSTAVGLVKDKPLKMNYVIPPELPVVQADTTRIRQVLLNFISNAAKFTEKGTITIEANMSHSPEGKPEIIVTVTDTGQGIPPEEQTKLFQPFSQVDASPTRKTGGTGLGLSISRSLIELHNGRIGLLWSEVGKGSTFFFTLPTIDAEKGKKVEPQQIMRRVLAIEDDPQVISLYTRYLKPHGYQVIPLTDSKDVVERVKEIKPFAITLDVLMPEKDGWEVIQELRKDPETRDIPIIICSIIKEEEKGFSLGASDYLVKPFLQEELLNSISRLNSGGDIHKILIIDDNPDDLRLVQKMIEENKYYEVLLAESGEEGWQAIQTEKPDAVILDLFMPDINGFTIMERLKSDPYLNEIPVVLLTGAELTPEQHKQLVGFGQELLTKGLLREKELLNTIERALGKVQHS